MLTNEGISKVNYNIDHSNIANIVNWTEYLESDIISKLFDKHTVKLTDKTKSIYV